MARVMRSPVQATPQPPSSSPVPVHVASTQSTHLSTVYATLILSSGSNIRSLLPPSDDRVIAFVQSLDDNVYMSNSESDVNVGNGSIVSALNGAPFPIVDSNQIYVGNISGTFSGPGGVSRVVITATYRSRKVSLCQTTFMKSAGLTRPER